MTSSPEDLTDLTARAVQALTEAGRTVTVAESLTSGQLAWLLGRAPGSGDVFVGGVVTYARSAKARVLGISPDSVVDADTAREMAERGRDLFDADLCVALTGVAGPQPQDGMPVGTVFIGWASRTDSGVEACAFEGEPDEIRSESCGHALRRLCALASNHADA